MLLQDVTGLQWYQQMCQQNMKHKNTVMIFQSIPTVYSSHVIPQRQFEVDWPLKKRDKDWKRVFFKELLNKLTSVFYVSVLLLMINFVITLSKCCRSTSPRHASGSTTNFDNVMTKFIINKRTDALKTDVNLFFTITKSQN